MVAENKDKAPAKRNELGGTRVKATGSSGSTVAAEKKKLQKVRGTRRHSIL